MGHLFSFLGIMVGLILFAVLCSFSLTARVIFVAVHFIPFTVFTVRDGYVAYKEYREDV